MKIKQTEAQGEPMNTLSIYMMSEPNPEAAIGYEFYAQTPATYQVNVWHRDTIALKDNITVAPNTEAPEPAPLHPLLLPAAATLIAAAAAITKKASPQNNPRHSPKKRKFPVSPTASDRKRRV